MKKKYWKFIKNNIIFILCLLFPLLSYGVPDSPEDILKSFNLPEMSDQEKIAFIESLAEPSKEKRVFYRWQSLGNGLLEELSPALLVKNDGAMGRGINVASDIFSSSQFGDALIQAEVELGYKFLNLSDNEIMKKLKEKGITIMDLTRLNIRCAVPDPTESGWFILKESKGIHFKPFSPRDMDISSLKLSYQNGHRFNLFGIRLYSDKETRKMFVNLIERETVRRLEESPDTSQELVNTMEKIHGKNMCKI